MTLDAALLEGLHAVDELQVRADADPWLALDPLPGQYEFLVDPAAIRLFRAGQQSHGKSTAGALDLIGHTTGLHPWCDPDLISPDPIEAWVIAPSWSHSITVQRKLWQLVPRHLLHPDTSFSPLKGFRGTQPAFQIRHRSGGYSTVRVRTVGQDGMGLSSETLRYAWFDELPGPRVFSEVQARLLKAGRYGRLILTCTPVNAPAAWLQEVCEKEDSLISDHHRLLTAEEMIPVGRTHPICLEDGTPCDEAWVEATIASRLPHEVPVVIHGHWSFAALAPIFGCFAASGPKSHVVDMLPAVDVDLVLGIDHGLAEGAQVAVLMAVWWPLGRDEKPHVCIIDEVVQAEETTDDQDAEAILCMLERNGLRWTQLKSVFGDRAHHGSNRRGSIAKKSNARLSLALEKHPRARRHGIKRGSMRPKIDSAKRGAAAQRGAVSYGCTWLRDLMLRPGHFQVLRRCREVIRSIQGYDMTPNSPESHLIDAIRYGLRAVIYDTRPAAHGGPVVVVR